MLFLAQNSYRTLIKVYKIFWRTVNQLAYFQNDDEYSYLDKYEEVTSWIYRTNCELI